jgi:hypothetical protein
MRRRAFPFPGGDWCDFYFGLLLLAGAFMRRSAFPVPWRGLVSFLPGPQGHQGQGHAVSVP